jgi:hypothetical protein
VQEFETHRRTFETITDKQLHDMSDAERQEVYKCLSFEEILLLTQRLENYQPQDEQQPNVLKV